MFSNQPDNVEGYKMVFPPIKAVVTLNHLDVLVWDAKNFAHCTAEGRRVPRADADAGHPCHTLCTSSMPEGCLCLNVGPPTL